MYFKSSIRKNSKTQKLGPYFRLVESYRDINNRICHRTILNVGFLEELTSQQLQDIQKVLSHRSAGKTSLCSNEDELVNSIIETLWAKIVLEKRIDRLEPKSLPKKIIFPSLEIITNKQVRELGKEWLCYQCLKQLDLYSFLKDLGWGEEQIQLTFTQIICRASYPASELQRSKIIQEISAVCEITDYPVDKISKDKLHRNAQAIYKEQASFEVYLSNKTKQLFNIKEEIILYNITKIYFEGSEKLGDASLHEICQDKSDKSKLKVLAMAINQGGFLKYSNLFEFKSTDIEALPNIVKELRLSNISQAQRVILIIDASIATDNNLKALDDNGYEYICVSRSKLKNYEVIKGSKSLQLINLNKEQFILQQLVGEKSSDYYLKKESKSDDVKLFGIRNQFENRIVEELEKLNHSILKKHGVKTIAVIRQRIDKILEKYPIASRCFTINIIDDGKNKALSITWEKKLKFRLNSKDLGTYFIRTNLKTSEEDLIWDSFNTIRNIETSFRTIRLNPNLYPIYHKNDNFTLAHLHLDLLAHWVISTVIYQLKNTEIDLSWQDILKVSSSQKLTIINTQNQLKQTVITKKSTIPNKQLGKIIGLLMYKQFPFTKVKSILKNQ